MCNFSITYTDLSYLEYAIASVGLPLEGTMLKIAIKILVWIGWASNLKWVVNHSR